MSKFVLALLFVVAASPSMRADFVVNLPFAVHGFSDDPSPSFCVSRFQAGDAFVVTDLFDRCDRVFDRRWDRIPDQIPTLGWFENVAANLTNGHDDLLAYSLINLNDGAGGHGGGLESALFAGVPHAGPDLAGYSIQSISLDTSGVTFTCNPATGCENYLVGGQAAFHVTVPEAESPLALALSSFALLLLASKRFTRRSRGA